MVFTACRMKVVFQRIWRCLPTTQTRRLTSPHRRRYIYTWYSYYTFWSKLQFSLLFLWRPGKCLNNIINKQSIHVTNYINKILEWYGYNGASASVMSLKFFLTASFHKNSSTTNPLTPPSPSQSSSYKLKASCTTLLNRFFL